MLKNPSCAEGDNKTFHDIKIPAVLTAPDFVDPKASHCTEGFLRLATLGIAIYGCSINLFLSSASWHNLLKRKTAVLAEFCISIMPFATTAQAGLGRNFLFSAHCS